MLSRGDEATLNTNKFSHSSTRSGLPFDLHINCRSRGAKLQGHPSSLPQPQHNHHHLRQRHHQSCQEESESPCSVNSTTITTTITSSLRSPAPNRGGGCHNQLPQGRQSGLTSPRGNDLNNYVTPAQIVEEPPRRCTVSREGARMTSDSGRNVSSITFHWRKMRSVEHNHANALLDQLFEKIGLCTPENLYQLNSSSTSISDGNCAPIPIRLLPCKKSNKFNTNYDATETLPESTAYTNECSLTSHARMLSHDIPAVETTKHRASKRVSKHILREGQLTLLCQLRLYQLADRRPLLTVLMRILLGLLVVTSVQSSPTEDSVLFDQPYMIQRPLVEPDNPEYTITIIPDQLAKHNISSLSSSEYLHHNQQIPDTSLFQFDNKTNSAPRQQQELNYNASAANSTEYAKNLTTLVHFKRKLNSGNIEQTPKTSDRLKGNESDVTSNINESTEAESNVRYARKVGTSWELHQQLQKERERAARRWAPQVWLHPQELFFPGDVEHFLPHVNVSGADWSSDDRDGHMHRLLPVGPDTEHLHLTVPLDTECCNCPVPAFLHGERPKDGKGPPVYAHVHACYEPNQKHAQFSQMSYLLEAEDRRGGAGRSLRDQIQTLSHPLQRPPRYRRRYRVVTGWREKRGAGEPAKTDGQPHRGVYQEEKSLITEASKHTTTTDTTSRLLPITNSIEVNKTNARDLMEPPTLQEVKEADKSSHMFKWNKVSLHKPHAKVIGSPNFKKIPTEKTEKKIIGEQSLVHEQTLDTRNHDSNVPSNTKGDSPSVAQDQYLGYTTPQPNPTDEEQQLIVGSDPTYPSETITGSWDAQFDKRHSDGGGSISFYTTPNLELQPPDGEDAVIFPLDTPTPYTSSPFQEEAGTRSHHFTVTYWFFYPYNRGKPVCTSNVWLLGRVAKPLFKGKCLGQNVVMGNHVGDWEHVSIYFEDGTPKHLYMSAHNFGAYYTYRAQSGRFQYVGQDVREGMPVRAEYPQYLDMEDGRLVLYIAKGSHGIWPVAGKHPYNSMVVPLHDETGRGILWDTSHAVEVIDTAASNDRSDGQRDRRQWLGYRGHWGNPSSNCHPGLLGFCELRDGPQGILMKRMNFPCHVPRHYTFPKE